MPRAKSSQATSYHSISDSATQNLSAGDVGLVLSKLNIGIEDITKRLRSEVSTHHLELLSKASSIAFLHDSLQSTMIGLKQIETNVERLQKKIGAQYTMLEESLNHLDWYQDAAKLCRRVVRFLSLSRRLEELNHQPTILGSVQGGLHPQGDILQKLTTSDHPALGLSPLAFLEILAWDVLNAAHGKCLTVNQMRNTILYAERIMME
ncbi:Golgi transport complex subunit 5-domain-containing protein [Phakopsora pachyrhizi]|nr:Golgi transport complex subunit 5-domain-containing protein [Phakopsora pachyrhizi]